MTAYTAASSATYKSKHIKHSPNYQIVLKIERETTFLVKSSSPFIAAVKRINKMLEKFSKASGSKNAKFRGGDYQKVKYVTVKGMGKSIEKTLSLGLKYQNELMHKVDIVTGGVEVLDEFKVKEEDEDDEMDDGDRKSVYKNRMVSFVECRIWIKRD